MNKKKLKVYKLIYLDDLNSVQTFHQIELFGEEGFRKRFVQAVEEGQICEDTITDGAELSLDTDWTTLPTEDMVEIFDADGYMVGVQEVEFGELDLDEGD